MLQVVHNRGHDFQKDFTLQGCTKVSTRTYTLVVRSGRYKITKHTPNGMSTGFRTRRFPDPKQAHGGHPTKLPASKSAGLRDGLRVCVDGCKRLGTRKCDWACRYRENTPLPKQYRCSTSHNFKLSSKVWHKYRIVIKPQTTCGPQYSTWNQVLNRWGAHTSHMWLARSISEQVSRTRGPT